MKHRWFVALAAAVLCLIVSISAGWIWQALSAPKFEARARLAAVNGAAAEADQDNPASIDEAATVDEAPFVDESRVLSPEVLSAAALLIADRNVPLSLASPFDSVTDYLLDRTRVGRPDRGGPDEILITCSATVADEALQMLSAVVDAYLDAATTARPAHGDSSPGASPAVELQAECEQLSRAIDLQQRTTDELAARLAEAHAAAAGLAVDDPITLEAELAQARRAAGDAAARLAEARSDLEKQLPAEFIAARIADIPTRTKAFERLNLAKIQEDLDQQQALRQKWSAIYGRNHPRMAELGQHIEALKQQICAFSNSEAGQPAETLPASRASIVLAALETESAGLKAAEQQLETRLAAAQLQLQQQHELESRLGESRQELEFLHNEHGRLWKEIDTVRRDQASRLATLIEPPALSPDPIAPQAGLPMAMACVSGMALCLLVIWQFRARRTAVAAPANTPATAPAKKAAPARRERFRSHEEQQLMRLKLQSAR